MNFFIKPVILIFLLFAILNLQSCKKETQPTQDLTPHETQDDLKLHLSPDKVKAMGLKFGDISLQNLSQHIKVNGWLDVSPQDRAAITPLIGANLTAINVKEGDHVTKGQVLGYLSHPDIIQLQMDYILNYHQLDYLKDEYLRQKELYNQEVASGKLFKQAKSKYLSAKGIVSGLEAQLKLMNINLNKIQSGEIYKQVPVVSPVEGYIEDIKVKVGQFIPQNKEIFNVINTDHIHADLMIFQKDVGQIKVGQSVGLTVENYPDTLLRGKIFAMGKTFENQSKAIHVHVTIEAADFNLFPKMYVSGYISTKTHKVKALPPEAIVREADQSFAFAGQKNQENKNAEWEIKPIQIETGIENDNWVEVHFLDSIEKNEYIIFNKAYELIAEMKKGEGERHH